MASILLQFPPPPRRSYLTVCEEDGLMRDAPESLPVSMLIDYPEINVQTESENRVTAHCESAQMAFLSHGRGPWKQALNTWHEKGLLHTLALLPAPAALSSICEGTLQKLEALKELLYPNSSLTTTELLSKYTHVSDWTRSPLQALAWHPHIPKVAIALRDSSVRVYSPNNALRPLLKHRLQKQVTDLAWQPLSSSVLAVACQSCVLIWHVEPTSLASRPSSSCVQILQFSGHSPVTSLVWTPRGDQLISASPLHSSIIVWDVPKEQGIPLRSDTGGGVPLMACSPDGTKLFTGALSPLFRIWETQRWNWEVWSELSGRCKVACWSPDGSVLIFAMEGDSALYAIKYAANLTGKKDAQSAAGTSVLLADLSQVSVNNDTGVDIRPGGEIHSVAWDETGERLAVMFELASSKDAVENQCIILHLHQIFKEELCCLWCGHLVALVMCLCILSRPKGFYITIYK
ncbi:aladin-like [Elysia marginata]|uniref:Aladin-like n=1 Tax=Elysia marginata TaxID=1093978 RepID=A0AAV4I0Z0_9GAST|nr:aladin-like [Elysia marginata]